MITPDMRRMIAENSIGLVATVTPEGAPRVSPKATMRVLGDARIGFADLRSPGTVRNIQANPAVEVNFIDPFRRLACRLRGTATYHARGSAGFAELLPQFQTWDYLMERMRGLVVIDVTEAAMIKSPAYDVGAEEAALVRQWLATYNKLHGET
jgi:predicted pyridoxine 5'-phosphate oxidase superfamily flavin-nucleotide-binding protein